MKNVQIIKAGGRTIAVIVKNKFSIPGMTFFVPEDSPQQLAFVAHEKGKVIQPHVHNKFKRIIHYTQEIDIIKKGKIKVDLYTPAGKYIKSVVLGRGDIIMFYSGGHGYRVIENLELILVKQGPYAGEKDKTHFVRNG
ncbi:MAG: hypothetical protein AB1633_00850 [Elusimicrobiota bacterium]